MDTTHLHQETLLHIDDFELLDFVEDTNLDQLINLIRSEKKDAICDFNSELISEAFIDNSFLASPSIPCDQCYNTVNVYGSKSTPNSFAYFDGEVKGRGGDEEDDMEQEHSSATTSTTTPTKSLVAKSKPKTDRSKTLISERRRRERMKEKLYALRSLVPFITKVGVSTTTLKHYKRFIAEKISYETYLIIGLFIAYLILTCSTFLRLKLTDIQIYCVGRWIRPLSLEMLCHICMSFKHKPICLKMRLKD